MFHRVDLASTIFLPMALAGAMPVQAAEHQYYVSTEDSVQALIIDATSKVQTGTTLRFKMNLLRRSPIHLSDGEIFWADGILEIECLEHRTRIAIVSGLVLDRSRAFDEPNPAFRPWIANAPGSEARTREEFFCRGKPDDALKSIASLTEFAVAFVGGEAKGRIAGAQPAEPAQQPPISPSQLSPYYLLFKDDKSADLLDFVHAKRAGTFMFVTRVNLATSPTKMEGADFYWEENTEEFDCVQHRSRQDSHGIFWTLDHSTYVDDPGSANLGTWSEDKPNTVGLAVEDLACRGKVHQGQIAVHDLHIFQRQYFASLKGP